MSEFVGDRKSSTFRRSRDAGILWEETNQLESIKVRYTTTALARRMDDELLLVVRWMHANGRTLANTGADG
ncbi:hypothetical protein FHS22_005204 [Planomonospora venezuelensis]|uniref:Uncharacterized protein n=1 Tax=Planomonospora venezuelensis TaxID=1999 RepID=A0A841DAP7_PLAVE|nr:hypothetical protein [Planomonospora venezuelensis]